jgi:hypothetical protein
MGTLVGVDENEELNQNVPGLGRGDDIVHIDMADGDPALPPAGKWPYVDGCHDSERPCTLEELTERHKVKEEAARASQRISAEEAKAGTVPAAREPGNRETSREPDGGCPAP